MPQKYRFDLSLYFTKFFVDDNHMKLLMDPGVVLEELGIKDEDSILSEIRSRYDFPSSICKQTAGITSGRLFVHWSTHLFFFS